jgi:hypothetical protein
MSDPVVSVEPDGTIHASVDIELPAEEAPPDEPGAQPTSEATNVLGSIIVGAAKAAGKVAGRVIGAAWDVVKPGDPVPQPEPEEQS